MKVEIMFSGEKNDPGVEYEARCEVHVDGETVANLGNLGECPEDANLGRDLRFICALPNLLRAAHEAGKRGDPFEVEEITNHQL